METHYIYDTSTRAIVVEIECESIDDAIEYYNAYYNDDCYDIASTRDDLKSLGEYSGIIL